jgi:hypothetical protein
VLKRVEEESLGVARDELGEAFDVAKRQGAHLTHAAVV